MIELLELSQVLDAVRSTGTEVRYHDQQCNIYKVSGFYQLTPNVDRLVVCPRNQLNHSDLFDTIRHEAVHVVQACYGGPIMERSYYDKKTPQHIKDRVFADYPESHHHHELEAFTVAEYASEDQIVQLIDKFCFE